jgi:hypothetical protein
MSSRPTCEMCQSIDVRRFRRRGQLSPGTAFICGWSRDGEPLGSVAVRVGGSDLRLDFLMLDKEAGDWRSAQQTVLVDWTPCYLGGGRPRFRCTASSERRYCGRRVAILYVGQ